MAKVTVCTEPSLFHNISPLKFTSRLTPGGRSLTHAALSLARNFEARYFSLNETTIEEEPAGSSANFELVRWSELCMTLAFSLGLT